MSGEWGEFGRDSYCYLRIHSPTLKLDGKPLLEEFLQQKPILTIQRRGLLLYIFYPPPFSAQELGFIL
jgi:hypothetical protein